MRRTNIVLAVLLAGSFLAGCSLAPDHKKPDMAIGEKFKEGSDVEGRWQLSSKQAGKPDDSAWWTIFNDAKLNQLVDLAIKENNSLKSAAARLEQSRALLRQTTGSFYPRLDLSGNASRYDFGRDAAPTSNFAIGGTVSYEANTLFQIKDAAKGSLANERAVENLYLQALLMVQADVATNYFALLSLDTERELLSQTIDLRLESQDLIEKRFKEGEAGEQDLLRAKAETEATRADLKALDQQRAVREHALSVLVGKVPADFAIEQTKLPNVLPRIPAGLPSGLLERRPDIAAAEQRMIQTNAQIGIARAAFFPNISLTTYGGLMAPDIGDLFSWSSRAWAFGPLFGNSMSLPLFDGGRRVAAVDLAKGRYMESVGDYRQQVLVAFKDVEDGLSALRHQAEQARHLYKAADAATKASRISDLRYKEGETSYLEVLDTQRDTLSVQRAYTQVQGARFNSTINLIRALGGGWLSVASDAVAKEQVAPAVIESAKPAEIVAPAAKEADKPAATPQPASIVPQAAKPQRPVAPPPVQPMVQSKPAEPSLQPKPQGQAPAPTVPQRSIKDIDPAILFD